MRDKNVSACDSIVKLLQWMKESKWTSVCELQPTEFLPIGLRGLMAKHKIDISDSIVRIPMNLLVTRKAAITFIERSKVFDFDSSFFSHMTTLELLAIFLIINKVPNNDLKCDQFWKPYIDTLPESYDVPYFCNEDEVNIFPSYLKIKTLEQKNKVWNSFSKISSLVKKSNKIEVDLEEFSWAWFTVNTRAVYFKDSDSKHYLDTYQIALDDDQANLALAPFLDLFNHSSKASVEAGFNIQSKASECFYTIKTNTKYQKYDQVFINYGPHGNLRLYLEYGFFEEENLNDFVPVSTSEVIEIFNSYLELSPEKSFIAKALQLVEKTKLHENLRIDNNGPSWNIAALFYVMNNVYGSMKVHSINTPNTGKWQNVFMIDDFSVYTEISSLLILLVTSKIKEVRSSIAEMKEIIIKFNGLSKPTKSFEMAYGLLKLHNSILESAVKYLLAP